MSSFWLLFLFFLPFTLFNCGQAELIDAKLYHNPENVYYVQGDKEYMCLLGREASKNAVEHTKEINPDDGVLSYNRWG
ncbi:hypothetical protein L596_029548 [Steinernema carpocapsae]|uniref:Uncharacterized protein n=1 Tax=Steinernema carpocapsae TaxID=34508 RepID=A0A4U5LUY7_STECR|nr:hypothetical protein L596_029548 [Steinernema carpocapsae]